MQDTHGYDIYPCDCRFKICQSCYLDARKEAGTCPGCKEPYKRDEYDNENTNVSADSIAKTAAWVENNRVSMMMKRSETIDSDQSWLFEVQQGSYGYDSAFWPKESAENVRNGIDEELEDGIPRTSNKPWKPLTRKIPMSAAIISPYRILILIRLVALIFFLAWRVKHPNEDAIWLWGMSVVCEIWFAISWILDQIPKLTPVNRSTDLSALQEKFETPSPTNEAKLSDLPGVDVFVSTADPDKEPPLVTANTILSILSADYPVEKLSCYISDDGGALLTFEAMAEAASSQLCCHLGSFLSKA
ncbi:uncharacterized protein A4U43_C05F14780 [Asparagus officinalis]|uniref:Cellulose synthase RING-type zinc finger domain-containing protein n=1 Tax=Asparagus officinalis TaxID=4686 RepID=A0A5P1EW04_ASPOF|nr:uncharacterized protein A4U43_C05F14780 [Asparagus officinalis]